MGEKVTTIMRLKVDLECDKCYKKVKKVLSKFPQIRDQVYDEKNNTVTIMVVCCSPEKTRDKICCKGCGVIKSIEILEPPKPKPAEKPKVPKQNPNSDPKPAEIPKEKPSEPKPAAEPPKLEPEKPKEKPQEKEEPMSKPKELPEKPKEKPKEKPPPPPRPEPPHQVPPPMAVPIGVCCMDCYHGRPGGPCFDGYGGPPQPPAFCYDHDAGYYGRPVYDSYYGGSSRRPCYVSRCDEYLCEDNTSAACIVM